MISSYHSYNSGLLKIWESDFALGLVVDFSIISPFLGKGKEVDNQRLYKKYELLYVYLTGLILI